MRLPSSAARAASAVACLYVALNARDLLLAWRDSPYDRAGWIAFLVWLAAAVAARVRSAGPGPLAPAWGVGVSVLGTIAEVNALEHAGLALVLAALLAPAGMRGWAWTAGALSWAPAFGYACSPFVSAPVAGGVRIALAAAAGAVVMIGGRRGRTGQG